MDRTNYIAIAKLEKRFGEKIALNNISLNIEKGEIFGFLGPNGAGKTTTISCMLDLIRPNTGTITVAGLDSTTHSVEIRKNLGYVPSDPYFFGHWTVKQHLDYVEKIKGKSPLRKELLQNFSLDELAVVRTLSTGNKQKLVLILALMHEPEVLILDEPTRGLDPLLQSLFYKYLKLLNKKGCTIFMSSHNLSEVETICDRVAIIRQGEIVEVANVKELQEKSIHHIAVTCKKPLKIDEKEALRLNLQLVSNVAEKAVFTVVGNINPALKYFSELDVIEITITRATLEEIFIEYYK